MYVYVYLHILRLHVSMFFTQASAVRMSVCLHICQPRICMLATRMCLCPDTNRSCSFAACPHSGCMNPGPVSKFGTSSALGQHRGVFVCVRASVSECVRACVSVSVFVSACLCIQFVARGFLPLPTLSVPLLTPQHRSHREKVGEEEGVSMPREQDEPTQAYLRLPSSEASDQGRPRPGAATHGSGLFFEAEPEEVMLGDLPGETGLMRDMGEGVAGAKGEEAEVVEGGIWGHGQEETEEVERVEDAAAEVELELNVAAIADGLCRRLFESEREAQRGRQRERARVYQHKRAYTVCRGSFVCVFMFERETDRV